MGASPGVHFVGSVPLPAAEDVFRALSGTFGERLRRIPDGETGERTMWVIYQAQLLGRHPQFEDGGAVEDWRRPGATDFRRYRPRAGVHPHDLKFDRLGYKDAAVDSWNAFRELKAQGVVPKAAKFMIALPTPYSVMSWGIEPAHRAAVEPAYSQAMRREVAELCSALPQGEICIQWDAAHDMQAYEGARAAWFSPAREGIVARLVEIASYVPSAVELGYHLCFGAFGNRHYVEPKDAATMVEVANGIASGIQRRIGWIHFPIPMQWNAPAYYEPLKGLETQPETEIFLGLIHHTDDAEANCRRVRLAQAVLPRFGVAAECGFGRLPSDQVPRILAAHSKTLETCC